jgi:hypothetical protein
MSKSRLGGYFGFVFSLAVQSSVLDTPSYESFRSIYDIIFILADSTWPNLLLLHEDLCNRKMYLSTLVLGLSFTCH